MDTEVLSEGTMMNSKIRLFASQIEPEAMEQIERTASMPFVHGLAVMPDVHFGKGSTVGTVVATKGAIMPACVGVDIGCGMIAMRTNLTYAQVKPHLKDIREGIERRIPLGVGPRGMNTKLQIFTESRIRMLEDLALVYWDTPDFMAKRLKEWRLQLGSLGGGNHFIEVCVGFPCEGIPIGDPIPVSTYMGAEVWVILHSGSRGVGNKTGTFWTNVAKDQAKQFKYDTMLPDPDLAYLIEESREFHEYRKELNWCQRFAQLNRDEMMSRVVTELVYTLGLDYDPISAAMGLEVERINCHHNYVSEETHGEEKLLITRKGAISAADGVRGLIPGSMGARSFVVMGLGNSGSFRSAPHGAGRRMSRNAARKAFSLEQVRAEMQGIEANVRTGILDEAPGAYKDIDQVMNDAKELVRPTHVLQQIISVKGD